METKGGFRRVLLVALALSLVVAAPATAKSQPPCRPSAVLATRVGTVERPEFTVEQNQIFVLSLASNPSTGYRWVVQPARPIAFNSIGSAYRDTTPVRQAQAEGSEPQLVGAGGDQLFLFKASVPPGIETMVVQYVPPGQATYAPAARWQTFTIRVKPPEGRC